MDKNSNAPDIAARGDRPTDRAMKLAVIMEVHAVCSTSTLSKGIEVDKAFPGYDALVAICERLVQCLEWNHDEAAYARRDYDIVADDARALLKAREA